MPTVKVGDIDVYYELHGAGPPLVTVMGLGGDISRSEWLVAQLARTHRVLAFDNRGAGRSSKPDAPYSIETMSRDMEGLLDALGIRRARVLAISMGGRIALDLALRRPDLVAALVLVSTGPRVVPSRRRSFVFDLIGWLPFFKGRYPQPRYAFARQRAASQGYDCSARLGELAMPTLILHGRSDGLAPLAVAEEMRAKVRGSRFRSFRGGHLFFAFRERQPFLEATEEFLRGLR